MLVSLYQLPYSYLPDLPAFILPMTACAFDPPGITDDLHADARIEQWQTVGWQGLFIDCQRRHHLPFLGQIAKFTNDVTVRVQTQLLCGHGFTGAKEESPKCLRCAH
jgi:hypothetical protein